VVRMDNKKRSVDIERRASEAHELIYGCSIENASEASAERLATIRAMIEAGYQRENKSN
jgi:hypothetical protein